MSDIFSEFAAICRKYGLQKNDATFQLFTCFWEVAEYMNIGQYEQNDFDFLEAAKLIRLLRQGTDIEISSANGMEMKLQNPILKAFLIMHLNTEICRGSAGYYAGCGLVSEKQQISSGEYEGVIFNNCDFTEPYTDNELKEIIWFEQERQDWQERLKGRKGAEVPKLGYYVQKFLVQVPKVFGEFYCYLGAEPLMKPTDQCNLIGDLLELAKVFEKIRGKVWVEDNWESWTRGERAHNLKDWLESIEKIDADRMSKEKPLFTLKAGVFSDRMRPDRASTARRWEALTAARKLNVWQTTALKEHFEKLVF